MTFSRITPLLPCWDIRQRQTNNILLITFWSTFSSYALNTIMILFLTRPLFSHGLHYDEGKAYAFIGVSSATGYLMPVLGGFMADTVLGIRRAILFGSIMIAIAYLLIVLSGLTIITHGDLLFIAAFALLPACSSLLIGTASGMVSQIYADDVVKIKLAMNFYYMAINVGALLATIIAPTLLDSRYGPLSVLAFAFVGKSIAALNFAKRYALYNNVIIGKDLHPLSFQAKYQLIIYIIGIYCFTLFAYAHIYFASYVMTLGSLLGIIWFLFKTLRLTLDARRKQLVALVLIIEAVIFFIIYNQMNTTLILFAKTNSNLNLLGLHLSPAQYQMLNPILILAIGSQLPRFYRKFSHFTIPYQFATGTILAACGLILMGVAASFSKNGLIDGNYIGLTYILISLAELWVSAIGLSMIGLYCDNKDIGFAMGIWYLSISLSNVISGRLAGFVAIPRDTLSPVQSLSIYQHYYITMGYTALGCGLLMFVIARGLQVRLAKKGIVIL